LTCISVSAAASATSEFILTFLLRLFEAFLQLVRLRFDLFHLFMMFLDGSSRSDPIVERGVLHTFDDRRAARIDFLRVVRTERGRDRRAVIHPTFQLELPDTLVPVPFCTALRDLVTTDVWFVQIVDEIHSKFDQKVPLGLVMVRVVQPVIKIGFRPEP